MEPATAGDRARFAVANVGGIAESTVTVAPGVTVLTGRNATNRTSFLQAVMAALGSEWATLKGDADSGRVALDLGDRRFERTLTRTENGVAFSGDGYLADPELADLFAFLLEDNEARRAVARGDDLRDIIMRPVDVETIRREIREAEREKEAVDDDLDHLASLKRSLPDLEQRRSELRDQIEATRADLADTESTLDSLGRDVERTREGKEELETALDELRATRSELKRVRDDIESEQESIAALREERGRLAAERSGLPDAPEDELDAIEAEIESLRQQKRSLTDHTTQLQNVVEFNEEMLSGDRSRVMDAIDLAPESVGDITDQLYQGSKTTCWTCGSGVKRSRIESTLDDLRAHRRDRLDEIDEIEARLDELTDRKTEIAATVDRRAELAAEIDDIDAELDRRQSAVADLRERRNNLSARVAELEDRVTDLRSEAFDEVLDHHRQANELEFELDRLESELEDVTSEIQSIETEIRREDELVARREALVDRLTDLRTRIDRLEAEATDRFNEHMATLLSVLDYDNVERIWLERTDRPTADGDAAAGSTFALHVVRTTAAGTAYEDTVDHLSESEREVTGLVFALAGYLVHDVHEAVPFMLLDSLEAIDSERIAALVDYFAEYVPYLVVALLPEDAKALDGAYDRITDI